MTPSVVLTDEDMDALVKKHRTAIDAALPCTAAVQQQMFRDLGVDPQELEKHHSDLQARHRELDQRMKEANRSTAIAGVGAAALAFLGTGALALKRKISQNNLVQGFAVGLSTVGAGFATLLIGSRVFGSKVRDDSHQLDLQARKVFERELAVALENREYEMAQQNPPSEPAAPALKITPRDPSFVTQAALDKARAQVNYKS